jgi:hypothetical protein
VAELDVLLLNNVLRPDRAALATSFLAELKGQKGGFAYSVTSKQRELLDNLIEEALFGIDPNSTLMKSIPAPSSDVWYSSSYMNLITFLTEAREIGGVKYPKVYIPSGDISPWWGDIPTTEPLTFGYTVGRVVLALTGSKSSNPGTINVTDGKPFGENKWFGRINKKGVFLKSTTPMENREIGAVFDLNKSARLSCLYLGHEYESCCLCDKAFKEGDVPTAGIHPMCEKKYFHFQE